MPLQIPSDELEAIVQAAGASASGLSVGELLADVRFTFARRTLQRRLERLVGEGRLVARGEGRGRRYLVPRDIGRAWGGDSGEMFGLRVREAPELSTGRDWRSEEAEEIRDLVDRPITERTPVGYDGAFLSAYVPNESAYLPDELRRKLAEIGQVGITGLPAGTYLRQVLDRLLIDLSWNSSRLEGNTYSLLETRRLLERGVGAEGKGAEEAQMILNHKAAIEMLAEQSDEIGFNAYTVCNLHALLSDSLLADPGACGRVRSVPVGISGTVYHPLAVPQQIEERFHEILGKAEAIGDPFEQAFFCMVHLPYLQPFEDVNKRVSRLVANIPLMRGNLCPLSFTEVPREDYLAALIGVYELNRVEYLRDLFVWAYQRSAGRYAAVRQTLGDPDPFRLRYRGKIGVLVREVVLGGMDQGGAVRWISAAARREIEETNQGRFIEIVETELESLHMGNIARYRLRPGEFERWKIGWE